MQEQRPEQALQNLEQAYSVAPTERLVRYWTANANRMCGNTVRSELLFDGLLDENKGDIDAAFGKAFLLRVQGRNSDASTALLSLINARPKDLETQLKAAGFMRDINQFDDAINVCQRAITLSPERADIHFKIARLYQATGKFEDSLTYLRQALNIDSSIGSAWLALSQLKRFENVEDNDLRMLENASLVNQSREAKMCIAFALGKANDDLKRWSQAWQQFTLGNNIHKNDKPWNKEEWKQSVLQTIAMPKGGRVSSNARRPVFIVGMIRSGTTLLEQRLDRHPDITGRGELNFLAHMASLFPDATKLSEADKVAVANELWTQMRLQGPQAGIYIDKNPLNFRFLNLLFEVLPEAKVIHIHRDGRDSCLSSYFNLFEHSDIGFSNNLNHVIEFYGGYRRLMAHWQKQYPKQIHNISYADLIESSKSTLSGVLDFVGAHWNEAVMASSSDSSVVRTASAWQARQPLYRRSLGRWENYYDQAPEFFDAIERIDQES